MTPMGIVEPVLATLPVDALEVAPVDAGDVEVALLPPAELQAVAVTSMTAAAAPMKYLLLRMLFLVSSPRASAGKVTPVW